MTKSAKDKEQIDNIDKAISELVYEKDKILKAYHYYHGRRDPDQYKHLEENYGIGTPTSVKFVPLVRKHVDVLIGEYLTIPLLPKVSCKDDKTISKITEDKKAKINEGITDLIKKHLKRIIDGERGGTPRIEEHILDFQKNLENTFISEYEMASQNIVDWAIQNREIDFVNNRRILLTDLLVSGTGYYRTLESPSKTSVELKILNPLHTFLDRNFNSKFHKYSQRVVIRDYLTKNEILKSFGEYLTEDELKSLDLNTKDSLEGNYARHFGNVFETTRDEDSEGILGGFEITPQYKGSEINNLRRFPVYDVEWLQVDREGKKFVTNRYRGIRISQEIYVLFGKVENATRTMSDPTNCTLSVNGLFYSDRNGNPFSLMLATADLQD